MKNRTTRILSIGIALVAVAAVHAQDSSVTAKVPFNFYVGSAAMPQGDYGVAELSHGAVVIMSSKDASTATTARRIVGKNLVEPAKLVFHRYGDMYFLAEIWTGDGPTGRELPVSPREKELASNGAAPTLAMIRLAVHR